MTTEQHGNENSASAGTTTKHRLGGESFEAHPLIAALDATDDDAVELTGYLGTAQGEAVRLYGSLSTSEYVEFAKSAVVYSQAGEAGPGSVRVFVRSASNVSIIRRERMPASVYRQGPPPLTFPPPVPIESFWTCAGRCETSFASLASAILIDETIAIRHIDPIRQQALMNAIAQRKHEAKTALYACLERCLAKHGPPLSTVWAPFSLGAHYSAIVARHLERPS